MTLPARPMPKPTAQVEPFFEVLGPELTVAFLLQFGGAELNLSSAPKGRSTVEKLIGAERVKALAESRNRAMQKRVPLAKQWLARMLHWQGRPAAEIARTLRATDVSVRGWLKDGRT
ncbi:MAG: helix-turn-helix domain-containing protein [Tabrizicola sp.]|nr:helix-turn-helix domain-containing protein [Tabrizicola sp.]